MSGLDESSFRALNPGQLRALALMEVDVYQRRRLPLTLPGFMAQSSAAVHLWSADDCRLPLACAVARAGGMDDAAAWSAAWLNAGLSLPDLAELRATPAVKRALWRKMRTRR